MSDHPFAARLRARATEAQAEWDAAHAERAPVPITQDEAEALADVLEAAEDATVCESSHPRDRGHCGSCPPCRLRAALERLAWWKG